MTSSRASKEIASYDREYVGDIPPFTTIPNKSQILIISRHQSYLTHGIHKYPAKFFPELPRYLIQRYSNEGQVVLDPMCGSGTVLLESLLSGRYSIGIDIDPMARLISRVKTTPLNTEGLDEAAQSLQSRIERYDEHQFMQLPEFHYRDNWFRGFVLKELAIIYGFIEPLATEFEASVVDFLKVVFSSIIRDVSNADPHCTRTVIRKKQKRRIAPGETTSAFLNALSTGVTSMYDFVDALRNTKWFESNILNASAKHTGLEDASVHLAITSPPYINAVDYPRTHQLEMYWLGLIEDGPLSKMKRKYIGTETVYKNEYSTLQFSGYGSLDPILEKIYSSDPRRSYIVYRFFEDMKAQLSEIYRVLEPEGHYCLAIGNNLIRGVPVESHNILTEIATSDDIGFEIERSFFSGLIRHFIKIPRKERMHGEWVLVLQKPT